MTLKGELVAVAKALMGVEAMKSGTKGLAASTVRVVMRAGTYPRGWKKKEESPETTAEKGVPEA
jgi:H/ACA ribonucleoprotein complex subunit 4